MRHLLTTSLAALLLAAPAFGATLNSAPARGGFSGAQLNCLIRNITTGTRTVTLQALNYAGDVVGSISDQTILPGQMLFLVTNEDSMPDAASCRFVVSGSPKSYRASTVYIDGEAEVALPAE
jgi:hypothetical protein